MKKIIFLLLTITSLFVSCGSKKPKDLIAKKWTITDLKMNGEQMPDSQKVKLKQSTLEFTKDGKMSLTGMGGLGSDQSGTYSLSEDGKTLNVMMDGKSEENEITELTDSKLVLTDKKKSGNQLTATSK